MFLLILSIKVENKIGVPKRLDDKSERLIVTRFIKDIISSHIQRDEFIILIKIIHLKINCFGESIFE